MQVEENLYVYMSLAAFAGLVLPDQPAAPPHNNQPVSAKFQTSERGYYGAWH